MTTKIAFLGFAEDIIQRQSLLSALFGEAGSVELSFPSDLRSALGFLVAKKDETSPLDGTGNVAYVLRSSPDADKLIEVAPRVNLAVAPLDQFEAGRSDNDIVEWINTGSFPRLPEPEPVVAPIPVQESTPAFVDPLDDLLGPATPLVPEGYSEQAPVPQYQQPVASQHSGSSLGSYQPDPEELRNSAFADDDIPLPDLGNQPQSQGQVQPDAWGGVSAPLQPTPPIRRQDDVDYGAPSAYQTQPQQEPEVYQQPPVQEPQYRTPEPVGPSPVVHTPAPEVPVYQQPEYRAQHPQNPEPVQQYADSAPAAPRPSFDDLISPPQRQVQNPAPQQAPQYPAPQSEPYPAPQTPQYSEPAYVDPSTQQQGYYGQQPPAQQGYPQQGYQQPSAAPYADHGILDPSQVRQAMPSQLQDSVIGRSQQQIPMPTREEPPRYAPQPQVQEEPEVPPYMAELPQRHQNTQRILEEQIRNMPAPAADEFTGKPGGRSYYITGSHGGVGKTTVAYMLSNVVANAIKSGQGDPTLNRNGEPPAEVWLVEADYRNPKLAHRLKGDASQSSGRLARFLEELDKNQTATIQNLEKVRANIIRECVIDLPSGAKVVTCPYDITSRGTQYIQAAIQQIVMYAVSRGAHVFIDADTLSSDDILDRNLATKADTIIMVGDTGHIEDLQRSANTMMKRISDGGMGIPAQKISVFLNRTPFEVFKDMRAKGIMAPIEIGGSIPRIEEWDTKWVGDQERGENFLDAIAKYAVYALTFAPIPELKRWEHYRTKEAPKAKKGGFMSLFRGKPKVKSK